MQLPAAMRDTAFYIPNRPPKRKKKIMPEFGFESIENLEPRPMTVSMLLMEVSGSR
jgi:hypothetical protein